MRPFRFGLLLENRHGSRRELLDVARRAEAEGYAILLATDHFGRLAPLAMLQAVAEATSLRVGTLVLNNDFRQPTVLAQELATLDIVTEGRLEVGIGAGWDRPEYEAAGLPFDRPGARLTRLRTAVGMLKQALSEGRIEHSRDEGYPAIRLEGMPTSVQRPHPPFLIGGGGPRMLAYAASEAQIVGLDPRALPAGGHDPADRTAGAVAEKVGWVQRAAGERWADLEVNVIIRGINPQDPAERESPFFLAGDAAQMNDALVTRRERLGINYITLKAEQMERLAPVVSRLAGT